MTDWKNVDLNSSSETDQNILDPYSFDALLLEIECNLENINEATVTAQFEEELKSKVDTAREIFQDNLQNIVEHARKEREE